MAGMASGTVSVRGKGAVWARPDRYRITFVISRVESNPEAALEDVARHQAQLEDRLAEQGVEPVAWSTGHVSLREEREWDGAQERWLQRGHRATVVVDVRHHDPRLAARLVQGAASFAEIQGPSWHLSEEHPALLRACAAAARDGRARAEAYAGALGLRLGSLTHIREQGTGLQPPPAFGGAMPMAAARQQAPALNLEPGEQEVTAEVELAFELVS
jgi:uncharacterized protein